MGYANERIDWLDSLKGFTMLLVIIGHCLAGYISAGMFKDSFSIIKYIHWFIYSFHMPLFFVLSGYAFSISMTYKKWKVRVLDIFFLYWIWSIIQFLVKFCLSSNVNMPVSLSDLFSLIYKPIPPYWYFYDLVFFVIIGAFVRKRNLKGSYVCLLSFIISLFSWYFIPNLGELSRCLYHFYFFYLGIYIYESSLLSNFRKYSIFFISGTGFSIIYLYNSKYGFFEDYIWTTIFSIFLILMFSTMKCIGDNKLLKEIGYYSLPIYVIHCFITAGIRIIFLKLGVENIMLYIIPSIILSVIIPIWVYKLCDQRRSTLIFFKPTKVI